MNNLKIRFKILFMVFLMSILFAQELPPYQAIITDIQGKVFIKRAQKVDYIRAVWGNQLFSGDHLKTMDQSTVSLLFLNSNLITLGANSSLTISKNQLQIDPNTQSSLNLSEEFSEGVQVLSFRKRENGEIGALAGLRSGVNDEIMLISPRNSKISTLMPEFRWQSHKEYPSYKISLFDDRGKIWSQDVNTPTYNLKSNDEAIKYGKSYFWYVEGQDLFESIRSESIGFSVPAEDECNAIYMRKENLLKMFKNNANSNSYQFVLGSYYEKEGFYLDAIETFKRISDTNPDAPLPHQILGNLFQKVGLKDRAIAELQKAVKLSNTEE